MLCGFAGAAFTPTPGLAPDVDWAFNTGADPFDAFAVLGAVTNMGLGGVGTGLGAGTLAGVAALTENAIELARTKAANGAITRDFTG